jgi:hypothetical protein
VPGRRESVTVVEEVFERSEVLLDIYRFILAWELRRTMGSIATVSELCLPYFYFCSGRQKCPDLRDPTLTSATDTPIERDGIDIRSVRGLRWPEVSERVWWR